MTIESSGGIGLNNTCTGSSSAARNQIGAELGKTAKTKLCMNCSSLRALAGKTGSGTTIHFSDLYGRMNSGSTSYTTEGVYTFVVPSGVTSISAVAIGGGGGGCGGYNGYGAGGGGGLVWKNSISVTPGQSLTVTVNNGGTENNDSYLTVASTIVMRAYGGLNGSVACNCGSVASSPGTGGSRTATGTYNSCWGGGIGGNGSGTMGGGGGAGGYSGCGGGGNSAGTGGGGGGGNSTTHGGGGVGLFGLGSSGAAGGGAGSGGTAASGYNGGAYGGAGGAANNTAGCGKDGALRILWGSGRSFPSTNVGSP